MIFYHIASPFLPVVVAVLCTLSIACYIGYQRIIHPLAKFPGPFLGSITAFSKLSYFWSLHIDRRILDLHEKYGPVVRIGPNELSFNGPGAVAPIYKSGRAMLKSHFYDGFTTFKPNLFGNRDEDIHAVRRRQMAHGFSSAAMVKMEDIFDRHAINLRDKLNAYADSNKPFDLKTIIAFYAYDVLGEVAFSTQFNAQVRNDPKQLPPISDHIFLASLYGSMPALLPYSMQLSRFLPIAWLQGLLRSRLSIRNTVARCVDEEIKEQIARPNKGKNLLTQLIAATDPETGATLTRDDICSEAFGFLVAGSHTTSGTLTLLFYHLLHHIHAYQRLTKELDIKLPDHQSGPYPYSGLENKLPFTMACIRENFRLTPVFTMPLSRTVTSPNGLEIDGHFIPRGTDCAITNYAIHHNSTIWSHDHERFNPDRWLKDGYAKENLKYLMPFGMGHRSCIGRNIAMINILKCLTIICKNFVVEVVDPDEPLEVDTVGIGEKRGPLICQVRRKKREKD